MKFLALVVLALFPLVGCSSSDDRNDANHPWNRNDPRDRNSRAPSDTARVTDPVCGMACDRNTSRTAVHNDKTYYFCSEECAKKFKENPDSYLARR